jgi:hypothetical protein
VPFGQPLKGVCQPHCHSFKGSGRRAATNPSASSGRFRLCPLGFEGGFVAPLDATPVCRSAPDSTPLQTPPRSRLHPARQISAEIVHRGSPLGANVCCRDGFPGMALGERRCFGVRAAERSVDAALVLPEEANPPTPNQNPDPFNGKPWGPRNPQRGPLRP